MNDINEKARKHEKDDIYIGDNISKRKEKNFRTSNYFIDDSNTILILIDLTTFGSAKNAIGITKEGIFWTDDSNTKIDAFLLEWYMIFKSKLTVSDELLLIEFSDGDKYTINIGDSDSSPSEILNLLLDLQALQNHIGNDEVIDTPKEKNNKKEDGLGGAGNAAGMATVFGAFGAKAAMVAIGTTATVVSAPVVAAAAATGAVGYGLSKLAQAEEKKKSK